MKERKKQGKIGCKFPRINPDENNYDEDVEFGEINNYVSESNRAIIIKHENFLKF